MYVQYVCMYVCMYVQGEPNLLIILLISAPKLIDIFLRVEPNLIIILLISAPKLIDIFLRVETNLIIIFLISESILIDIFSDLNQLKLTGHPCTFSCWNLNLTDSENHFQMPFCGRLSISLFCSRLNLMDWLILKRRMEVVPTDLPSLILRIVPHLLSWFWFWVFLIPIDHRYPWKAAPTINSSF